MFKHNYHCSANHAPVQSDTNVFVYIYTFYFLQFAFFLIDNINLGQPIYEM